MAYAETLAETNALYARVIMDLNARLNETAETLRRVEHERDLSVARSRRANDAARVLRTAILNVCFDGVKKFDGHVKLLMEAVDEADGRTLAERK